MEVIIKHDSDIILYCDIEDMRESIKEAQDDYRQKEEPETLFRSVGKQGERCTLPYKDCAWDVF